MGIEPFFKGDVIVSTLRSAVNQGLVTIKNDLTPRVANVASPVNYLIDPKESEELVHLFLRIKVGGPLFVQIYEEDATFNVTTVGSTELTQAYNARFDKAVLPGVKIYFNPTVTNVGASQKGNVHLGIQGTQGSGNDSTGDEGTGENIIDNTKLYLIEFQPEFDATDILSSFAFFKKNPQW